MKKIIIIGAGVSGLSAGIFAQKKNYETLIFEKNHFAGGNLTGWKRKNCYIDNCIHWLNGSKNGNFLNKIWNEVGAFDNLEFYQSDNFIVSEFENEQISLNKNLETTHKAMLKIAPEDIIQIEKFIDATKLVCELENHKGFGYLNKLFQIYLIYKNKTIGEVANKFKNPLLRKLLTDYIIEEYSIYTLIYAYATFVMGDGKVLKDGSLKMAENIANKYVSLGGKIKFNSPVSEIIVKNKKAIGVKLENGEEHHSNYVICCTDPQTAFNKFLTNVKMPVGLQKFYNNKTMYPVISSFHVAYKVKNKVNMPETFVFETSKTIKIGATEYSRIMLRNYAYGKDFTPDESSVLQVFLLQREKDYDAWESLSKTEYEFEKQKIVKQLTNEIVNRFAEIELEFLDCWTPFTYTKYFDAYKGSYMSFGITKNFKFLTFPFKCSKIKNLYFASQWNKMFGGLPNALLSGKNCIKEIFKHR